MSATSSAATYVGRIGGLAVALGVGAAIASGAGTAAADTGDSSSTSSSADSSSSSSKDTSGSSKDTSAAKDRKRTSAKGTDNNSENKATTRAPDKASGKAATSTEDDGADDKPVTAKRSPKASIERKAADDTKPEPVREVATAVTDTSVDRPVSAPLSVVPTTAPAAVVTPTVTPAITEATEAALTKATPRKSPQVTRMLSVLGVRQAATPSPTPPAQAPAPALAGLLGWVRREVERAFNPGGQTSTSATTTAAAAAVVDPLPTRLPSTRVGWVTGPGITTPGGFQIYGTDLGIMWDGGVIDGKRFVHVAFGDTFSGPNMQGGWRSNALLISFDNNLANGLGLAPTGYAGQFIPGGKALSLFGSEVTVIPTAGIRILDRQYVNYMSVKSWDTPGRWTTNFSAISRYNPVNDKWEMVPSTIRSAGWLRSSTAYRAGDQNFQQMAYVLQPEDQVAEGDPRYLYAFGTPSGRAGSAYLSRVAEGSVTELSKYEYWDGKKWVVGNAAVAKPVIGTNKSSGLFGFVKDWANDPNVFGGYLGGLFGAKTGGNVSEMSVQYNEYLKKYVVLYGDGNNNIQMRVADTPEAAWSAPVQLASSAQYPGLYAPMIHPWSGTGALQGAGGGSDYSSLYWNMSIWGNYNVVLMKTDLSPLQTVAV